MAPSLMATKQRADLSSESPLSSLTPTDLGQSSQQQQQQQLPSSLLSTPLSSPPPSPGHPASPPPATTQAVPTSLGKRRAVLSSSDDDNDDSAHVSSLVVLEPSPRARKVGGGARAGAAGKVAPPLPASVPDSDTLVMGSFQAVSQRGPPSAPASQPAKAKGLDDDVCFGLP